MFNKKTIIASSICLAITSGYSSLSYAEIEVIKVTSQKRVESVQEVPIAITAFSADTMEALDIKSATDLVSLTPGLSSGAQSGSNTNYFLRGVGTNDFHLTSSQAIGQYFDGVTLTSGFHARAALFDMERVEVLKGPQNILFGLNTTGGAVNYISKKPSIGDGTTGRVALKLGNDARVNIEGALGFDITDDLAARVSFQTNKQDGPFKSEVTGLDHGDDDLQAYRGTLLWEPNSDSTVTFNVHGIKSKNNGSGVRALGTLNPDGSGTPCEQLNLGVPNFEDNTNCVIRGAFGVGDDPSTGDWETTRQGNGIEELDTVGAYLKWDYDLDWATFNWITAYDNLELFAHTDSDGGSTLGLHVTQGDDRDTFQQELRLISSGDGDFRWIAGVYYLKEESESYTLARSVRFGGGSILPNIQLDHTKENLGLYFQGEYDFTDALTLTAGVRWSDEEIIADYLPSSPVATNPDVDFIYRTSDIDALVANQFIGTTGFDENGYETVRQVQQKLENKDVGYTVKLDWKVTDDSLAYLSLSKGFKGGAADIRGVYALVPAANVVTGLEDARLEPESLEAWELGYKMSFWENRIQANAAVFNYIYSDLQQFVTEAGVPTLDNAPESEILGLDANVIYGGDSGLFLELGVSLLDSEITDAEGSSFIKGAELASAPDFSYSFTATQAFELDNGADLSFTANISHTSGHIKTTQTNSNSLISDSLSTDGFTLLNANATYRFGNDQQYAVSVFGKNLTDEKFCGNVSVNDGNQILTGIVGAGGLNHSLQCRVTGESVRSYGVSFSVDFY